MVQLHVNIDEGQLLRFKAAVKSLGYATVSEYVRARIREAIEEAGKD